MRLWMRQLAFLPQAMGQSGALGQVILHSRNGLQVGAAEAASFIWRDNPNQICVRQ
jgi:hypothetical protein